MGERASVGSFVRTMMVLRLNAGRVCVMPLYDYACYDCGNSFEMLRRMNDDDREVRCPECGSERIERILSTFATGGCGSSRFR